MSGARRAVTVEEQRLAERCARGRILVIDDDREIRVAFRALFELEGYACATYDSAAALLAALTRDAPPFPGPCCLLCDVMMPEQSGLDLQRQLAARPELPMLLMSGVSGAVEAAAAFRAGAVDFLVKPIDADALLAAVARALALSTRAREAARRRREIAERFAALTARELEVAHLVARGLRNREIGTALGISLRTVKRHRQQAMCKLEVEMLADLIRLSDGFDELVRAAPVEQA